MDNIQDVDFIEHNNEKDKENTHSDTENKTIRGKRLYYSTSQVASILDIPDSKVRYYTSSFDEILHIEISNKQRRYTEEDIDKLKFILSLKEEGLTIKQIQEYCQEVDFNDTKDIQVKESNPLHIKALAQAITEVLLEEQDKKLNMLKQDIVNELVSNNNLLNEQIAITVDEIVESKLNQNKDNIVEELTGKMDEMEKSFTDLDNERISNLKKAMDERLKAHELEQSKKKGLFGWFKRG